MKMNNISVAALKKNKNKKYTFGAHGGLVASTFTLHLQDLGFDSHLGPVCASGGFLHILWYQWYAW